MINSVDMMVPELRFKEFNKVWKEKKLGDIATFTKGKGISKADISEDGALECIRYGELYTHYGEVIKEIKSKTNLPKAKLILSEANDVIIPASGEARLDIATASCVLKGGIALSGDLNIIKAKLDGTFLAYYLNSKKKKTIASLAQGVSVVHLYSRQLKSLKLNVPTLPEQQKIANFLTTIDTKIQQLTKKQQLLEAYKKGVMQQLFSQEIRFKDEDGKAFPDWEVTRFGTVVKTVRYGPRFNAGDYDNNGNVKTIRGTDISLNGEIEYSQVPTAKLDNDFIKNHILDDGDLVMITTADCGMTGVFRKQKISYISSAYAVKISLNSKGFPYYFKYFFQTRHARKEVNSFIRKATVANLPGSDIPRIKLNLPSVPEQQKIANFLTALDDKIAQVDKQLAGIQAYKKGLLQQIFI